MHLASRSRGFNFIVSNDDCKFIIWNLFGVVFQLTPVWKCYFAIDNNQRYSTFGTLQRLEVLLGAIFDGGKRDISEGNENIGW